MAPQRLTGRPVRWRKLLVVWLLLAGGFAGFTGPAWATESSDVLGVELTPQVSQQLNRLQEIWQRWTNAYSSDDQGMADAATEELLSVAEFLGMSRLPDLSIAASSYAVVAARDKDFERAEWTLTMAEKLDPGRPETELAKSTIQRLRGDYLGVVSGYLKGTLKLVRLNPERRFLFHGLIAWATFALVLSAGLFIALQLATKGGRLVEDFHRQLPATWAAPFRALVLILFLVWPMVLPAGLAWLTLYWSVLIWGYGSASERTVLISLWLLFGAGPWLLAYQQRVLQLDLSPSSRAIHGLAEGRLYGSLFADFGVLRSSLPESPAVLELTADLHRRLGQWDYARPLYNDLVEHPDQSTRETATSLVNLGVFHHRNGDYATAIIYFRSATEANPLLAEAFFNLSQAFSQSYDFAPSQIALAQAKELDKTKVDFWLNSKGQEDPASAVVALDGGLWRRDEIGRQLWSATERTDREVSAIDRWRPFLSPVVAVVLFLLALAWRRLSAQWGERAWRDSHDATSGWVPALVPGFASTQRGHGGRAFFAIALPVALVLLPWFLEHGYRIPLGYDAGLAWAVGIMSLIALMLWFFLQFRWGMADRD